MAGGTPGKVGGAVIHGEGSKGRNSKEYRTWLSMRSRCRRHPHYLKHGVQVCARWQSFVAFVADVGRAPSPKYTLDRWPNADGHYEPGNVRWATMLEQRHNRREGARVGVPPWTGKRRALNGERCAHAKLTAADVSSIRVAKAAGRRTIDLARLFNVSTSSIKNIISGRTWNGVADGHA